MGIVTSYKVKVKLVMNGLGGDVTLLLPFSLMHSKPSNDSDNQRRPEAMNAQSIRNELSSQVSQINNEADRIRARVAEERQTKQTMPVNLISFDEPPPSNNVVEGKTNP